MKIPTVVGAWRIGCLLLAMHFTSLAYAADAEFRLATFAANVTPPIGHPLIGGTTVAPNAVAIDDPLFASGFVLVGGERPIVFVAIDWCEIRNDAYDRWRDVLAEAAGTTRERVLVSSIHQHDAPLADLEADRILEKGYPSGGPGQVVQTKFHEACVQKTAAALREGLAKARRVTHVGVGRGLVEHVSSNRRYLGADGKPRFDRSSMSGGDGEKRDAPDGTIDPWLQTLSFWDDETAICALHVYAVHPMSHWGSGRVTSDFPGLARERRQADDGGVFQIYASGCSGNVGPGKYNDGAPANKRILAERLHAGMLAAWKATKRQPLSRIAFRSEPIRVPVRETAGYSEAELTRQLEHSDSKKRSMAALGLSWRKRVAADRPIDLPVVELGPAAIVLLPGEAYVEYQLLAHSLRPDMAVFAIGYGESAAGYIPTEQAWKENDTNPDSWSWTAPGAETALADGLRKVMEAK